MHKINDINLAELYDEPPPVDINVIPEGQHQINGPLGLPKDENGNRTAVPYLKQLMQNDAPFMLMTYNDEDQEVTWVYDNDGNMPYVVEGWIAKNAQEQVIPPFITCKYFVPSEADLKNPEIALPDDHNFDRAMDHMRGCMHPDYGIACIAGDAQFTCDGYEPDLVKTPVHFKIPGENREVYVQTTRTNLGVRTVQTIEYTLGEELDDVTVMETYTVTAEELDKKVQESRQNLEQKGSSEEVVHQVPRNSFLKGLIATP